MAIDHHEGGRQARRPAHESEGKKPMPPRIMVGGAVAFHESPGLRKLFRAQVLCAGSQFCQTLFCRELF